MKKTGIIVIFASLVCLSLISVSMSETIKEYWKLGDNAFGKKQYDLAIDYYLKALELSEGDLMSAQIANNIFYVYKTLMEQDKAIQFFRLSSDRYLKEIAKTSDPSKLARIYIFLARLHMDNCYERNEYLKAEEYLKNAIREFSSSGEGGPKKAEALYRLGIVIGSEGRNEEALRYLKEASSIDFGNAMYLYRLGCAYVIASDLTRVAMTVRKLKEMETLEAAQYADNLASFAMAMGLNIGLSIDTGEEKEGKKVSDVLVSEFETIGTEPELGLMAGKFIRSALAGMLDPKKFSVKAVGDVEEMKLVIDGSLNGFDNSIIIESRVVEPATFRIISGFSATFSRKGDMFYVCKKIANDIAERLKNELPQFDSTENSSSMLVFIDGKEQTESYLLTQTFDGRYLNVWVKTFNTTDEKKKAEAERLGFSGEDVETSIAQYIYSADGYRYALVSVKYFNPKKEMLVKNAPSILQWEPVRYGELPYVMYLVALKKHRES